MLVSDYGWVITFLSVAILYLIYWYRRPSKFPPGPQGVPFLGYFPAYKSLEPTVYKLSKKFGRIMSVRIIADDVVFLNDYETINKAFVKQGAIFAGRPRFAALESIRKGHGVVFTDNKHLWKTQRNFGLLLFKGFGLGKKKLEKICEQESRYLVEEIKKSNEKPTNMSVALHNAVSNVICSLVLGKRFEYDDQQFIKMLHVIIDMAEDPFISFCHKLVILAPILKKVPPISWGIRTLIDSTQELIDFFDTLIKEHEARFDPNCLRDFVDAFLAEKKKGKDETFTTQQLLVYMHDLFLAGTETASTTLSWTLLCLLHYPEAQKKLRKEVLDVFGESGEINYSKKNEMPYTNAFIHEMYRYRTLIPSAVPHKTGEDTHIDGHFIPKNTTVISNLWAVHNDPSLWKEPEKFIPERFIDEKGNFVSSNYVIPFGVGSRRCLGEQLARIEIFNFLVSMIQKFEFIPDPDKFPSIDRGSPGFAFAPKPFKVIAKQYLD